MPPPPPAPTPKEVEKRERRIIKLTREWTENVLGKHWSKQMRNSSSVQKLLWYGIPPQVRPSAWSAIIGNDLKITEELFEIFKERGRLVRVGPRANGDVAELRGVDQEQINKEHSLRLIETDIPRTFPLLKIFHENGPLHEPLVDVLQAYVAYRPDIGYVQGMSYLASMLLLNTDTFNAFVALANLLHQDIYYSFFRMDVKTMRHYVQAFQVLFQDQLSSLFKHFKTIDITPDMFIYEWLLTVFSRSLPLDIAHRIWDNFLYYGPSFLFRTALGILRMYQPYLLKMGFENCLMLLNRPPAEMNEEDLFECIGRIKCSPEKFETILEQCKQ
jgi:hypothetical protein